LRLAVGVSCGADGWNEVFILFNPHDGEVSFRLPDNPNGEWIVELSTAEPGESKSLTAEEIAMQPRSLILLRRA
jgi:glycogen operon protein